MSKITFITGANTGLGLETVKALCRSTSQSYTILVGCRTPGKGEAAIKEVRAEYPDTKSTLHLVHVDLQSDASIEAAVKSIDSEFGKLDILVNNGGGNFEREYQAGDISLRDVWNKSWDVNVSGTHVLTFHAAPLLLKSSDPRLLFMTSGTSSLEEILNPPNELFARRDASPQAGWPKPHPPNPLASYRSAKAGLNMLMLDWTRLLKNDGVKVWAVSPGFLATGLAGIGPEALKKIGAIDPSIGANLVVDVVRGQRDADTGKIVMFDGKIQAW